MQSSSKLFSAEDPSARVSHASVHYIVVVRPGTVGSEWLVAPLSALERAVVVFSPVLEPPWFGFGLLWFRSGLLFIRMQWLRFRIPEV